MELRSLVDHYCFFGGIFEYLLVLSCAIFCVKTMLLCLALRVCIMGAVGPLVVCKVIMVVLVLFSFYCHFRPRIMLPANIKDRTRF